MIRKINMDDYDIFLPMAESFYNSSAVSGNVEKAAIKDTFKAISSNDNPFVKGYFILYNNKVAGFFIISFTFQTQYGNKILMFEDMYIKPKYQGLKLGSNVFNYLEETYKNEVSAIKFEVAKENINAIRLYERLGYKENSYLNMLKEF